MALPRNPGVAADLWRSGVFEDSDPQVRLAACLAMSEMPRTESGDGASRIIAGLLDPRNQQDRWMGDALTFAAAAQGPRVLQGAGRRGRDGSDGRLLIPVTARVAEHYARGGPVDSIALGPGPPGRHEARGAQRHHRRAGEGMAARQDAEARRQRGEGHRQHSCRRSRPRPAVRCSALASRWGVKGLGPFVAGLARDFLAAASDASKPDAARIDAARQLIDLRKADPQACRDVLALVTARTPPDLASGPHRRRGAERLARGRPGARRRDRADDPGGPQGEHPGAAGKDRLDGRAGERDREGEGGDVPPLARPVAGIGSPSRQQDRRAGQGPAGQRGRPARPGSREGDPGARRRSS